MTEKVFFSSFINTHLTFIFGKETSPVSHHDQILIFGIETIPVCHHQGKGIRAILIRTGHPMTMNGRKKQDHTKAQHEHRAGGDDVRRDGPRGRRRGGYSRLPLRLAVVPPARAPAADPGGPAVERLARGARHRHAQPAGEARQRREWRRRGRLRAERRVAPAGGGEGQREEGPEGARGGEEEGGLHWTRRLGCRRRRCG